MKSAIFLAILFPVLASAAPQIEYAALEQMGARIKRVIVQGDRNATGTGSLGRICSEKDCFCELYFEEGVLELPALRASSEWNTVSCRALEGMDPASVSHVRVKGPGFETPKLLVKRALSLGNVLGKASPEKLRRIYRYGCERSFFEGEGVSERGVSCVAHQRLGILRANYDYYLYASARENNMKARGADESFPSSICGYGGALRTSCTGTVPELLYGIYGERQKPFEVPVHFAAAPGREIAPYGFVARADSAGDCPTGLVPAATYVAEPVSIGYGRDGNLPSSFVNSRGALNNRVLSTRAPTGFFVSREANSRPCDADGNCTYVDFQEARLAQSVNYTRQSPTLCVIPRHLVIGL